MKINPINLNFIQNDRKSILIHSFYKRDASQCDTFSFTGKFSAANSNKVLKKLVPKHKGLIYEKIRDENGNVIDKVPVEVKIVKTAPNSFVFKHGKKEVGGLIMCYRFEKECGNDGIICKNYPKYGINGARLEVDFVSNNDQDKYCGIAHLADLIEVASCKKLGIEPNIISCTLSESAPLHYKRGKRFMPFKEYDAYYLNYYGDCDPNYIVEDIIKRTPKGEKFDTSKIKHSFLMYMPKEMVKELETELEEHPIF